MTAQANPRGLFVTGAGTDVGKTRVAASIARALVSNGRRVGVYKPLASGGRLQDGVAISDDALELWHAAARPGEFARVCPQCFLAPVAPHLAARAEGRRVDVAALVAGIDYWRERSEILVVEGAGGFLSPISDDQYVADLAQAFGYPLLVVAADVVGAIHQTLATLAAISLRPGLRVAGVVLSQTHPPTASLLLASNHDELAARTPLPVLGTLKFQSLEIDRPVDWWDLASANDSPAPVALDKASDTSLKRKGK